MASVNKVILVGNLGADPEMRQTSSGDPVCTLSVATTEKYKNRDGEQQSSTEWHKVVLFRRLAEIANQYLRKGSSAYFEGQLKTRKWTDKNGLERYTTEVEANELKLLDRQESQAAPVKPLAAVQRAVTAPHKPSYQPAGIDEDIDIPF
ncbi:MAG: single-stranded DNA-binding protein [Rhodoferax sp.]|uniref:single-stranded DNA-binding protein n=1 Tax=Rhodoferax sp. TaxID=50421 RepID=UPI00261809C9|nr:single-stranded DNA-binding protein [Rhodoferax sp.]MDD2883177.1 single-stranded DNA-binding protein [Rhodoferax sp.]